MPSSTLNSSRGSADETRIALRVGRTERDRIARLAKVNDRTLSSEIRRAIRFYLTNFDLADGALCEQASAGTSPIGGDPK